MSGSRLLLIVLQFSSLAGWSSPASLLHERRRLFDCAGKASGREKLRLHENRENQDQQLHDRSLRLPNASGAYRICYVCS